MRNAYRMGRTGSGVWRLGSGRERLDPFVRRGGTMEPTHVGCYESWGAGAFGRALKPP